VTAVMPLLSRQRFTVPLGPALQSVSPAGDPACRGRTELFFGPHAERREARERREAEARALCLVCPVLEACRAWARERREYGFWGGESEEERAAAGFPVALAVGRVAQVIRSKSSDEARASGRDPATGNGAGGLRSMLVSRALRSRTSRRREGRP
jgi:WhiB family transcriptional regulator, redox-sensing transcriptional regulator